MKICRECSNMCEGNAISCSRCGSDNLAVVEEKLCSYCKSRIALGTIICPYCHRVLPPETAVKASGEVTVAPKPENAGQVSLSNITVDQDESAVAQIQPEKSAEAEKISEEMHVAENPPRPKTMEEFNNQNPLFAIYDKAPDILGGKKEEERDPVPAVPYIETLASEEVEKTTPQASNQEFDSSEFQTRTFETSVVSYQPQKEQNKMILFGLFLWMCVYTAIGLATVYLSHDYGDVLGYQMSSAVFVSLRDVFPSVYPYILYGSKLLAKYELIGSHLPFAMNFGMMFAVVGGIATMISIVPKWAVATLNALAVICHLFGIWMMWYLFGFRTIGVACYVFAIGALTIFVLHLILVRKTYKNINN
ncbi:MAG: zinc ribbon domain-containing protein [Bacillota bacterium]